jgi:hypothetical protein
LVGRFVSVTPNTELHGRLFCIPERGQRVPERVGVSVRSEKARDGARFRVKEKTLV